MLLIACANVARLVPDVEAVGLTMPMPMVSDFNSGFASAALIGAFGAAALLLAGVLGGAAMAASAVPALRATRVDPANALRGD